MEQLSIILNSSNILSMKTLINQLKKEIARFKKESKVYINQRRKSGDIDDGLTAGEWLEDWNFDDPYANTAWESGYLKGMQSALSILIESKF